MSFVFLKKHVDHREKGLHFSTEGSPSQNEALQIIYTNKRDLKFQLSDISQKSDDSVLGLIKRMRTLNFLGDILRNRTQ